MQPLSGQAGNITNAIPDRFFDTGSITTYLDRTAGGVFAALAVAVVIELVAA